MAVARYGHTAILSGAQQLVIVGGFDSNGNAISEVELFDTPSGTFSPLARMLHPRGLHSCHMLTPMSLLVVGGTGIDSIKSSMAAPVTVTELFSISTNSFTSASMLTTGHVENTATSLMDSTILVAGGYSISRWSPSSTVEIFNRETTGLQTKR
jgi:hypothetical protein